MSVVHRHGILPQSLQDTLLPYLETWDQKNVCFGEYPRSKEKESMIWMQIQEIRDEAQQCGEEDRPESEWSHTVIRPLIKYAVKYTPWDDRTMVRVM
jgi:hypothetical protein